MMNDARKLAFIAQMTAHGLNHVASTPNQMSPKGEMSHDKKLAFVSSMAKQGLQHFDSGGAVNQYSSPTPASVGGSTQQGSLASVPEWSTSGFVNPIGSAGASAQGIGAAFTAQNGYQAGLAPTTQLNYQPVIGTAGQNALNGYQNSQDIQSQQQGLANQLQQQTLGQGPNPAQAALNQATGNNVQTQAALMASQRGAGSNPALIARQAAQQGAATQQTAAGQGATLQAQQQIAAEQALQQQQANLASGNVAEQGVNASLFNSAANANNSQNNNQVQNYGMEQGINSQVAQNNTNAVNKSTSGLIGGAGSLAALLAAKGGMVKMSGGGLTPDVGVSGSIHSPYAPDLSNSGVLGDSPSSNSSQSLPSGSSDSSDPFANIGGKGGVGQGITGSSQDAGGGALAGGAGDAGTISDGAMLAAKGGKVSDSAKGPRSHVGRWLNDKNAKKSMIEPMLSATGGKVKTMAPGEGAVKSGNSYSNDKIPALLSEGEIVLPRSVTMHKMAPEKAAEFVRKTLAKKGLVKRS